MACFRYGSHQFKCCCLLSLKDILTTPLGKSSKTVFALRGAMTILSNWLLFSRVWFIYQECDLIPTRSTVVLPCARIRTAPRRSRSLNASAGSVSRMIAGGSDRNSLMLLCKHGVRPRRHCWFFRKRVLYSLINRTRFTANFSISLTPLDETMDDCVVGARTGWLTILECGACTEFILSIAFAAR